ILQKGGHIAQIGTPAEILADPADDFVADFIGANRGKRALHIQETPTGSILVDDDGRPAGVLMGSGPRGASGGRATEAR
ncbi:MAG: transporter ATP-binding protein, partial [Frondihabitans sp.]|nr:transporter ATP-binding protein [Frondihabitans sp.]